MEPTIRAAALVTALAVSGCGAASKHEGTPLPLKGETEPEPGTAPPGGAVSVAVGKTHYGYTETIGAQVTNGTNGTVCFESCATYHLEKQEGGEWKKYEGKSCDEHGVGPCAGQGETLVIEISTSEDPYWLGRGTYRVAVPYCIDCDDKESFEEQGTALSDAFDFGEEAPAFQADGDLEQCIEAPSFAAYSKKAGIKPLSDESMEGMQVDVQVPMNIPDAAIYNIAHGHAGGDVITDPIIRSGNRYCPATDHNLEVLFAPIDKDEVTDWVGFRLIDLAGSSYGRCKNTVLAKEQYESLYCDEEAVDALEKRQVTRVKEVQDGYVVDWVWHTHCGAAGFYKTRLKVGHDATIQTIGETERLVNCGKGKMF